ncbi:MAG: PaaI family thioesterase [Sphingobacteriales bacterium JAD_PAG50586_3]|nr:MAG: PaaI family thioesterase [Sphingobacteriales bacterium JAD_PAG50586_3]
MSNPVREYFQSRIGSDLGDFTPPFSRWLNGKLLEVADKHVTMEFTVREDMANPVQMMHGGVHAAIIDEMTGMMVASLGLPHLYVSIGLTVDFVSKAKIGETIIARASLDKQGMTVMNTSCEIRNLDGQLLSRGTCNLVNTSKERVYSK